MEAALDLCYWRVRNMAERIPYKTIVACKLGDEEALKTILKHYEPLIVEASKRKWWMEKVWLHMSWMKT